MLRSVVALLLVAQGMGHSTSLLQLLWPATIEAEFTGTGRRRRRGPTESRQAAGAYG